jgi:DNA-binding PadR family transcriptional regulator
MTYLGEFEQLVLFSLLKLDDDAHGVSIRDAILERTGREVSSGAIYTALSRLEQRGLVTSRGEESTSGRVGRPRKYWLLEPAGARALMDAYATMQSMAGGLVSKLAEMAVG